MKYIIKSIFVFAFVIYLSSCAGKDSVNSRSLSNYIQSNGFTLVKDQLIACAVGGQSGFLED